MSATNKLDAAVTPRTVFWSVVLLLALTAGVIVVVTHFLMGGPTVIAAQPHKPGGARQVADTVAHPATSVVADATGEPDYSIIATRSLIQSTVKPTQPPNGGKSIMPTLSHIGPYPVTPLSLDRILAYTGTIQLPSGTYILLQNVVTRKSLYTQVGGMAFGCKVVDATDNMVTLDHDGTPISLSLGQNKTEDRGAPTATNTPPAAGAPAAGAAGQMNGTPGDATGFPGNGNFQNMRGRRNRQPREG